jgi:hypothetical protein
MINTDAAVFQLIHAVSGIALTENDCPAAECLDVIHYDPSILSLSV